MDLSKLDEPFAAEDIEWRAQQCGITGSGAWAIVLAYVTNRAIMKRLDDVCGKANWRNEYKDAPNGGLLCGVSIRIGGEWITKWDGADNTNMDAVKGGLSGAMKRAAVQWGIGRYLYSLESEFAKATTEKQNGKGWKCGATKDKKPVYWQIPNLPAWALPKVVLPDLENVTENHEKMISKWKSEGYTLQQCMNSFESKYTLSVDIKQIIKETYEGV